MHVFVSLNIPDSGIDLMKEQGIKVTMWTEDMPMSQEQFVDHMTQFDALLSTSNFKIDAELLKKNQHLQIISQYAVGYDNIDIKAATDLGIPVGNDPDSMTDATADTAFLLMLATSRKFLFHHKRIAKGDWKHFQPKSNLGIELKNKTLGIFGLGRIGLEFAKRCKGAYNMNIIYCNRSHNQEAEELLDAKKVSFEELLTASDVISAHCALTDETRHTFNKSAFEKMKSTAIFINTSRGAVHQESDLIDALKNGHIWGAGLDVTDPEPMNPSNPLLNMENVSISPHIGSATQEARNRMSIYAAENIIAKYKGEKIPYLINKEVK